MQTCALSYGKSPGIRVSGLPWSRHGNREREIPGLMASRAADDDDCKDFVVMPISADGRVVFT